MQNLIVFMEPSEDLENISLKAGMLYLNRFCIDENAANELSGVYYLKKSSKKFTDFIDREKPIEKLSKYEDYEAVQYKIKCEIYLLFFKIYFSFV